MFVRSVGLITVLVLLCGVVSAAAQDVQGSQREFVDFGDRIMDMQGNPYEVKGEWRFCDTGAKGGGVVDSSVTGKYLVLWRCVDHQENPNPLPVVPCWSDREKCDAVIVVVDTRSWRVTRMFNQTPLGRGEMGYGSFWFAVNDRFLLAENRNGTEVWAGPEFVDPPVLVSPYRIDLLGRLDAHLILARSWPVGRAQGWYFVLRQGQRGLEDTGIHVVPMGWGYELQADVLRQHSHERPCPQWRSVYADDVGFAALFPKCEGVREHARVAAYRFSGGAPAVITLPDGFEGLRVERVSGVLRCSWAVGGKSTRQDFVFPKKSFPDLNWWYEPYREPAYWLDEQGVLKRLSDGAVCDYAVKPDGTRYDFLPYGRRAHLWTSPGGRYLVIKGALNPKDNPHPGPCDRPGYFRKGYDSVLMVVDTRSCRPARILNVRHDTSSVKALFTEDDRLLLVSESNERTKVYKAPAFNRIAEVEGGLPHVRSTPRLGMTRGRDGKKSWYWWWTTGSTESARGVVIALDGDQVAEVPQAEQSWKTVYENFYYGQTATSYEIELRYVDDRAAVFAGIKRNDPEAPILLVTATYAAGAPKLEEQCLKGASDLTIRRRPDGSIVCEYITGKGRTSKVLWKPPETGGSGQNVHPTRR